MTHVLIGRAGAHGILRRVSLPSNPPLPQTKVEVAARRAARRARDFFRHPWRKAGSEPQNDHGAFGCFVLFFQFIPAGEGWVLIPVRRATSWTNTNAKLRPYGL